MVTVTVELNEDIERQARERGLLTTEGINTLLERELARQRLRAWNDFQAELAPVQAAFRKEYGHLTDDDFMAMVSEVVQEVREDNERERRSALMTP